MARKGRNRRRSTPQRAVGDANQADPPTFTWEQPRQRNELRGAFLRQGVVLSSPWHWFGAALVPIGIGWFMYALEASDVARFRLRDPVPAMGQFVSAVCVTHRKGHDPHRMNMTYAFRAPGFTRYDQSDATPRLAENYSILIDEIYDTREDCEAELPAVVAAKEPHPVWYERSEPHTARRTLEEPDSTRFLWVGLGALPLAAVGWWLRRRERAAAAPRA